MDIDKNIDNKWYNKRLALFVIGRYLYRGANQLMVTLLCCVIIIRIIITTDIITCYYFWLRMPVGIEHIKKRCSYAI